jgi:hypothetical protein
MSPELRKQIADHFYLEPRKPTWVEVLTLHAPKQEAQTIFEMRKQLIREGKESTLKAAVSALLIKYGTSWEELYPTTALDNLPPTLADNK